jgi:quercetin dioxygenase-like cupin family protein
MSAKFKIDQKKPLPLLPGIDSSPLTLKRLMVNLVELKKKSVVPPHTHSQEQLTFIFSGKLAFELEGKKFILGPGEGVLIPGNARHSARALQKTLAVDSFSPPRKDYLQKLKRLSGK